MKFKKNKLKEFANVNMGQSPRSEFYNTKGEGMPFLQGVRTFGEVYPYIDTFTTKAHKIAEKGEILFTVRAPVGDVNICPEKICIGRGLASISSENNIFLYYLLRNSKKKFNNVSTGTIYSSINKKELENLEFMIPNNVDCIKIANILFSLDKKIEVNNKIIDNLEKQAQAIFKSWFIDFEPFQDGNFVESELGMIPEGWEVKKLKELFEFKKGRKPKALHEKFEKNFIPYQVKGVIDGSENPKFTNEKKIVKIDELDTFMLMDGANSGNIYYGFKGALGSTFSLLETKDKKHDDILYWFLKTNEPIIKNQNTGSAIPHANKDFIYSMNIAVPYNCKNDKISKVLRDFRRKIIYNNEENKKLAEIRDALLPKLMSGEIDVSNIKIKGEEVKNE